MSAWTCDVFEGDCSLKVVLVCASGSNLKRLGLSLSLASAGFAVCYPVHTIAMLKVKV